MGATNVFLAATFLPNGQQPNMKIWKEDLQYVYNFKRSIKLDKPNFHCHIQYGISVYKSWEPLKLHKISILKVLHVPNKIGAE